MEKLLKKKAKAFMNKDVISVQQDETIKKVFNLMDEHAILGIPVVDDEKRVIGIVTETDLIRHFTTLKAPRGVNLLGSIVYLENISEFNKNLKDHCAEIVKDIMIKDVTTVEEEMTLMEVIDLMGETKYNRLPVIDKNGKLTGIITRTDMVHQLSNLKKI